MEKRRWKWDDGWLKLRQLESEPNLWKVIYEENGTEVMKGLVVVYVDDMLILASDSVRKSLCGQTKSVWEVSAPEEVGSEAGVRFCGMELWLEKDGTYILTQENYIKDLVERNGITGKSAIPMSKDMAEPEVESEICYGWSQEQDQTWRL